MNFKQWIELEEELKSHEFVASGTDSDNLHLIITELKSEFNELKSFISNNKANLYKEIINVYVNEFFSRLELTIGNPSKLFH